jgi:hypothetical protein
LPTPIAANVMRAAVKGLMGVSATKRARNAGGTQ